MAMVSIDNVGSIIAAYIDQYIIPQATGLQKVASIIAGAAIAKEGPNIICRYYDLLEMLGFASDHKLDIDKLKDYAVQAFNKTGRVKFAGILFDSQDVEALAEIAAHYAQ